MKITLPQILGLILLGFVIKSCGGPGNPDKEVGNRSQADATSQALAFSQPPQIERPTIQPVQTRTLYVGPTSLNVRSSPNGKVIDKLAHGEMVVVYITRDGWSRISRDEDTERWVSANLLCTTSDCSDIPKWAPKPPAPTPPVVRKSTPSASYGCPCSSNTNCYGPRGGRYCITSGGNKRYR